MLEPTPACRQKAYKVPRALAPCDLRLDGNEGHPPAQVPWDPARAAAIVGRYPDTSELEALLSRRYSVPSERLLVTAGADDALDRACRAFLPGGRNVVLPVPGFVMMARYAEIAGGVLREVFWPEGSLPIDDYADQIDDDTGIIVVTTPNNPTGAVASEAEIRTLAERWPDKLVLVDLAYIEFADDDPTRGLLDLDNVLLVRTLSKAWGLAGLRVGFAIGSPQLIGWLRAAGAPYAVSGPSVAMAESVLTHGEPPTRFVERIRTERKLLAHDLGQLGARPRASQANFVLTEVRDSMWFRDAMAGLGIAVRAFPGARGLEHAVRISCPGDEVAFARLQAALSTVLSPKVIVGADLPQLPRRELPEAGAWVLARDVATVHACREVGALALAAAADPEPLQRAGAGPALSDPQQLEEWLS